jgi:hypothetical protein
MPLAFGGPEWPPEGGIESSPYGPGCCFIITGFEEAFESSILESSGKPEMSPTSAGRTDTGGGGVFFTACACIETRVLKTRICSFILNRTR